MQKEYFSVLLAGFDHDNHANIINLLENFKQSSANNINLRFQVITEYSDVMKAINENCYKVCLLNSELQHAINNKIVDEIQNRLIIQNKSTAIIIVNTHQSAGTKMCYPDQCSNSQNTTNGCITEINLQNLDSYWLSFVIKSAVEKLSLQKEIKRLAHYDNLTGLVNRNLYLTHLNHALALAEREKRFCRLIYLDINNFKSFNNKLGYKIGDQILIECAQRIKKTIRSVDIAARLGSDEFAILLENYAPKEASRIILDLKTAMAMPYSICNEKIQIECSIDYASYPDSNSDKISFLNNVRQAHYLAKTS